MPPQDDPSQEGQSTPQSPQGIIPQAPALEESPVASQPTSQTQFAQSFQPQGVSVSPFTGDVNPAGSVASPVSIGVQPAKAKRGKKLLFGVLIVLLLVILGAGGVFGYTYYQEQMATKAFSDLALQVKNQELDGARNYVKVAGMVYELTPLMSLDGTSGLNQNAATTLNKNAGLIDATASSSCKAQTDDVTAAYIDQKMKGLSLNAAQQRYISDIKQVVDNLNKSEYSNAGLCREGPVMAALIRNIAKLLPGLSLIMQISSGSTPTAAQMNTLKSFANASVIDQSTIQSLMPQAVEYLTDLNTMLGDLYYELAAVQAGDLKGALSYDSKISDLSNQLDADEKSADAEMTDVDKSANGAATKASQVEIAAIDYQVSHKTATSNMQLDYALPSFRIADAVIGNYEDAHNNSYPYGSSIQNLADLDSGLKRLQDAGHLKNLTYSSHGSDQSGFSLSAILADGTKLTEELDASTL